MPNQVKARESRVGSGGAGSWLRHPPAGTDAGLEFMRTTFPNPQYVWLRRADKVRQGISWWRAAVTNQWGLRPGQEAEQPAPDVEQMVQRYVDLVRSAMSSPG